MSFLAGLFVGIVALVLVAFYGLLKALGLR
jgi:hypothetical protein